LEDLDWIEFTQHACKRLILLYVLLITMYTARTCSFLGHSSRECSKLDSQPEVAQNILRECRLGTEQLRDESYPLRREPQDMGETTELPSPEVQVLLAVMGAAALQLAHAALGCVRIMDTLVPRADSKLGESLLPALAATQASVGRCSIVEGC
jgi:hypothetical protein